MERYVDQRLTSLIPDGFQARRTGRRFVAALPKYLQALADAEFSELPEAGQGRGSLHGLQTPEGALLIRQCRRGGLLRLLNKDRYLSPRRPFDEIRLTVEAGERGVLVARPAGAVVEHRPPFWLCWLATEEIEEAIDLGDYLRWLPATPTREVSAEKRDIIDAAGKAVRSMHDASLWHADLQVKNILLRRSPAGVQVFIIDLDKSRILPNGLSQDLRAANLRRLNRSVVKTRPDAIDDMERQRFLAAYRSGDAFFGSDTTELLKSCRRHAARHSLWWKLFG